MLYQAIGIGYHPRVRLSPVQGTRVADGAVDFGFAINSNHRGRPQMKTAIVKTLTVGVAALMLATATGCTSKDTLARIDAANAAAKAAAQDAAAAKSSADAAAAGLKRLERRQRCPEHGEPGPPGGSGCAGLLRRDEREDRSRVQEVDGQVSRLTPSLKREKDAAVKAAAFFCPRRMRGPVSTVHNRPIVQRTRRRRVPASTAVQARLSPAGRHAAHPASRAQRGDPRSLW
jgi:hypothetical protein